MILLSLLIACTGASPDSGVSDSSDAVDTVDTEDTGPACTALTTADDWAWKGECPQMTTPCELSVNACAVSITYSSGMDMNMPYSATVSGDTVTFDDNSTVTGCVGTITGPDTIEGTCGSGCTFTLQR